MWWVVVLVLVIPSVAWATTLGGGAGGDEIMAPVSFIITVLTVIFYLVGGMLAVGGFAFALMKFFSGRDHLQEGLWGIAGAVIGGVVMWQVAPAIQEGISAHAATPEQLNPPAIIQEWDGDF